MFGYLKQIQSSTGLHAYNYMYLEVSEGVLFCLLSSNLLLVFILLGLEKKKKKIDYGFQTPLQEGKKTKPQSQGY